MDKMRMQEMISALADGQLQSEALESVIQTVATDDQARSAWHIYHLIGDVLRSGNLPTGTAPAAFLAGFQVRLEGEQALGLGSDAPAAASRAVPVLPTRVADSAAQAANDGSFRWKLVAGVASLAAVTAIGWSAVVDIARPPQMASAVTQPSVAGAGPAPVMIRDPRLDEMLAAHRQLGGSASALQTSAGFLRNATFEGPAR